MSEPKKYQWLIRVMRREKLDDFENGKINFSKVGCWLAPGSGVNDIYEGCMAIESLSYPRKYTNCVPHIRTELVENNTWFERIIRDKRIEDVSALCFYGIEAKDSSFTISKEYFKDFAISKDDYGFLIVEAASFNEEIKKALINYGFNENDLFSKSIEYIKKGIGFVNYNQFPYELYSKDFEKYGYQNEYRFLIVSTNMELQKKFNSNFGELHINIKNITHGYFYIPNSDEHVEVDVDKKNGIELKIEKD